MPILLGLSIEEFARYLAVLLFVWGIITARMFAIGGRVCMTIFGGLVVIGFAVFIAAELVVLLYIPEEQRGNVAAGIAAVCFIPAVMGWLISYAITRTVVHEPY